MEQKQVRSQFSHETMEELRKRVLDLEDRTVSWMLLLRTLRMPSRSQTGIW